jgi:phage portal protein BeeE
VNALLRGDMKARAEFYKSMTNVGAMSPNEIRQKEDMNPREGGDIYLTPLNMAINGKPAEENTDDNET